MASLCPRRKVVKNSVFFGMLFLFFVVIWLIVKQTENFENCWAEKVINCGEDESTELLILPTDEPDSHPSSIMLLEGHFHNHLSPRMLCSIESAAMAHPTVIINVMMTSEHLRMTPATVSVTKKYRNVRIFHLNMTTLFEGSPMEEWFLLQTWQQSRWPKSHFNDAVRWMLLWKYGGVYLDMDVVVMKYLMHESNFVGLESYEWAAAGAIGFIKHHPLIEECLHQMAVNFDGTVWGANGPELLTHILVNRCGMELPSGTLKTCPDIQLYQPNVFYPIPWWEWYKYLYEDENLSNSIMNDPDIFAIHVWNMHTHAYPVMLYESNPYAIAANKFCPIVVYEVGYKF